MKKYPLWRFHVDSGPASLFRWEYHEQLKQRSWPQHFGLSNRVRRGLGDLPLDLQRRVERFVGSSAGWELVVVKLRADNACPWFFIWETRMPTAWCHLHARFEIYKVVWGRDEESRQRDLPKNIIVGGGVYDVVASLAAQDNFGWICGWNLRGDLMHIVRHPIELAWREMMEDMQRSAVVRSLCVMSAKNAMTRPMNGDRNQELSKGLEKALDGMHYVYRTLSGEPGALGNAYVIFNISESDARWMAAQKHLRSFVYAFGPGCTSNDLKSKMRCRIFAVREKVVKRCQNEYMRNGRFPDIPLNAYVRAGTKKRVSLFDDIAALAESVASDYTEAIATLGTERFHHLLDESLNDETTGKYHYQCRALIHNRSARDSRAQCRTGCARESRALRV